METPSVEDEWAKQPIPVKKADPEHFQWATHVKDRYPQFKIHRTVGHARSAITNKFYQNSGATSDMAIYQRLGEDWVPVEVWQRGDKRRPSWWEPVPEPKEVQKRKRQSRFMSAYSEMVASFQNPDVTYEELLEYGKELDRLYRELKPVAARKNADRDINRLAPGNR